MNLKIEKGVPIPEAGMGRCSTSGETSWRNFEQMEVGDSVLVSGENAGKCPAYNSATQYGRVRGKKFSARKEDDGVRIWRTA